MNTCVRCNVSFVGRYPKTKICKGCSKRGMPRGENHWNYKDGSWVRQTYNRELKEKFKCCTVCSKDLTDTPWSSWVIHHIDHNHFNDVLSNLTLLCKRCHQIEHNCINNLKGATTIPKGSTLK